MPAEFTWVEAGRQPYAEMAARSVIEARVELPGLVALSELSDEKVVAALQRMLVPVREGSAARPAPVLHSRRMLAPANQRVAGGAMAVGQQRAPPMQYGARRAAAPSPSSGISLPAASALGAPHSALHKKFETIVMCNFTPRHPSELPKSQWVSYQRLFRLFEPHAPMIDVWLFGPSNLKKLITEWYKLHPAFAGLEVSAWCKRLVEKHSQGGPGGYIYKFSFQHISYQPEG